MFLESIKFTFEKNIAMEENLIIDQNNLETPKRPQFLTVLCILSFVWSAFILLCLFLCLIFSSTLFTFINEILSGKIAMPTIDSNQEQALRSFLDLGQSKFVVIIAGAIMLYMTSLLGVFKMWRQEKWGFYIYAIINILGVGYDIMSGSFVMAIISMSFIAMYYSNVKCMK